MAELGKSLPHKQEDMYSHPQHPYKMLGVAVYISNPSTGVTETQGSLVISGQLLDNSQLAIC